MAVCSSVDSSKMLEDLIDSISRSFKVRIRCCSCSLGTDLKLSTTMSRNLGENLPRLWQILSAEGVPLGIAAAIGGLKEQLSKCSVMS